MTEAMINSIISTSAAIVGALLGYIGAIRGAKLQIKESQKKMTEEEKQGFANTARIIGHFLEHEIEYNLKVISSTPGFYEALFQNEPPNYQLNTYGKLKFDEFDRIKYDILKYYPFPTVCKEFDYALDTYHMFQFLNKASNMKQLSKKKYDFIGYAFMNALETIAEFLGEAEAKSKR